MHASMYKHIPVSHPLYCSSSWICCHVGIDWHFKCLTLETSPHLVSVFFFPVTAKSGRRQSKTFHKLALKSNGRPTLVCRYIGVIVRCKCTRLLHCPPVNLPWKTHFHGFPCDVNFVPDMAGCNQTPRRNSQRSLQTRTNRICSGHCGATHYRGDRLRPGAVPTEPLQAGTKRAESTRLTIYCDHVCLWWRAAVTVRQLDGCYRVATIHVLNSTIIVTHHYQGFCRFHQVKCKTF